jgi:hypothetical protein
LFNRLHDAEVRRAAFDWLTSQVAVHGDVLPRQLLADGFILGGRRVPLVGPQGIFKPGVMEVPLSITICMASYRGDMWRRGPSSSCVIDRMS